MVARDEPCVHRSIGHANAPRQVDALASSCFAPLATLFVCAWLVAVRAVCADSAPANLAIVALVATSGAGHLAQLLARRAFLHCEHLQLFLRLDVHRLENDVQRLTDRLRARKRYIKAAYKLLRGKSAQANAAAAHRCPYI